MALASLPQHPAGCTAEQYLLNAYDIRLTDEEATCCMLLARPVASHRGGPVELVSSQCHLRAEEGTRGGGAAGTQVFPSPNRPTPEGVPFWFGGR